MHHVVDVLGTGAGETVDVRREDPTTGSDGAAELTKVHLMPTLSAAWKARVKFLLCDMKRIRFSDWSVLYTDHNTGEGRTGVQAKYKFYLNLLHC